MKKLLVSLFFALFGAMTTHAQTATLTPSPTTYSSAGGTVTFTVNISYSGTVSALGFTVGSVPTGWTFGAASGTNVPENRPSAGGGGSFVFSYATIPTSKTPTFTFTATYPAGLTNNQTFGLINLTLTPQGGSAASVSVNDVIIAPAGSSGGGGGGSTGTAPKILTQPTNVSVSQGQTAAFGVLASGDPTPTYQWRRNGFDIFGATNATYGVLSAQVSDSGTYAVLVSNSVGAVLSNDATLTVNIPPSILSQPSAAAANETQTVTFAVSASGTPNPTYQWRKGGNAIAGATNSSLTLTNVGAADVATYDCVVTNVAGSVTSTGAALTVVLLPTVTSAPSAQAVTAGGTATFNVTAGGTGPFTYQWRKNGIGLSGQNTATLTLTGVSSADTGNYDVVINNTVGSVVSPYATLTVNTAPAIVTPPFDLVRSAGQTALFSVDVVSTGLPTFQWRKNSVNLVGANVAVLQFGGVYTSVLTLTNVQAGDVANYDVVVTNTVGSVTSPGPGAALSLITAPAITAQPSSQTATTGGAVGFSVTATGTAPLFYQWRKNTTNIAGATGPTLNLVNITSADLANYDCVVTNAAGSVTSGIAGLTAVNLLPSITTQPVAQSANAGGTVTFSVTASGSPSPSYQWRKNGLPISPNGSAFTASLTLSNLQGSDAGNYDVIVSNSVGALVSTTVSLTVNTPPAIIFQPATYTVLAGQTASFQVTMSGTGPFTYQWRKNGVSLAGATNVNVINGTNTSMLNIFGTSATDAAAYDVVVTNALGSVTSNGAASLFVVSSTFSPNIVSPPQSQTVTELNAATFSVLASGNPAPTYQWYRNGVQLADGANPGGVGSISGSATSSLTIGQASLVPDATTYYVVVTNTGGTSTSSVATLTVNKAPVFTTQPTGSTVASGGTINLTSVVSASGTIAYQWFKDGLLVSGANSASLTINSATVANAGNYSVVATNNVGATTSSTATVSVTALPVITLQPVATATATQNQSLTLSVAATGGPAPTYQWSKDSIVIPGATNATYTIISAQGSDAGTYTVAVTATGTVNSNNAVVTVLTLPSITSQPTGGSFNQGQSLTLSVSATGGAPLSYQWYKDGVVVNGAKSSSLPLPSLTSASAGLYTCVVSNPVGSSTSGGALVQVSAMPAITDQPKSTSAFLGESVTFTVVAVGNPGPSFQWSKNGVNINGAVFSTLTISNAQKTDAGIYRVSVSNSLGTVTSVGVSLAVQDTPLAAPTITTQPVNYTGTVGTAATLTVAATGTPAPSFQWRKDGNPISGATNTSFVLTGTLAESGAYSVVVSNTAGSVTSNTAQVLIKPAVPVPVIVVQPASRTLQTGASATLTVQATGQGPLTYQWRKDGTALSGATTSELALTSVTSTNAGVYTVTVTNEGGSTPSANATITISSANAAPRIVTQPLPQVAIVGGSVTFSVVATGTPAPVYQWRKNGTAISGQTGTSLTLTNVQAADAAGYDVTAINSSGQAISALARLTVATAAQAPVITRQPSDARVVAGRSVTFAVVATGTPAPTYQWRLNGSVLLGATNASLLVSGVTSTNAGAYSVVVTNTAGSVTSNNGNLTVLARSFAGAWFGTLGTGGSFALAVSDDNTGVFLGFLGSSKTSYVSRNVSINDDGTFRFTVSTTASTAASANPDAGTGTTAAGVDDLTFAGTIAADGALTGASTSGATLSLTAARSNDSGATAALTGFYQAAASGSSAQTLVIVSPAGQAFVIVQSGASVDGGTGTVSAAGALAVTTAGSQSVAGTVSADTGAVTATVTDSKNVSTSFSGYAAGSGALGGQRLLNISTRASAGIGEQAMIVGFVITGVESKTVLIRGVGPTLRTFGLTNAAAAPRLDLARGTAVLATNIDWTKSANTAEIIAAAALSGAFPLGATSADSVILTTLAPGQYTASCSAADAKTGVALVEVYDLSGGTTAQKLVNISTRAVAGAGENVLTAGVVVSGNAPKRVLIRAVGPTLSAFGLTGALARPQLTLFNSASASVATNAGWSTTADAGAIAEAAVRAGAFAFPAGSLDAALLVNLAPGNYTAQVTGVGGTSGLALVEIYELP